MATRSRSALEYLLRKGHRVESFQPAARLDVQSLLIHKVPLPSPPGESQTVREQAEGAPPPDHGAVQPWPNQPIPRSNE